MFLWNLFSFDLIIILFYFSIVKKFWLIECRFSLCSNVSKFLIVSMVTSHTKGMQKLTIMVDDFGIVMVTKKCLCAMFNFNLGVCMFLRMMLMMNLTMWQNQHTNLQLLVHKDCNGLWMLEDSNLLGKIFPPKFKTLSSLQGLLS